MPTTSTARIANDSLFCEAHAAMDKIIEQLLAMADQGATADAVTQLIAKDGAALLRELVQGYFDRRAQQERRVKVVGADGIERAEVRTASRRIETPVGEIEVKRLLYQAPGVEGLAPLDAALGLPDEKYTHDVRRIVAEESAKSSFDEVVELIAKGASGFRVALRRGRPTGRGVAWQARSWAGRSCGTVGLCVTSTSTSSCLASSPRGRSAASSST